MRYRILTPSNTEECTAAVLENRKDYNVRTARLIQKWMANESIQPIHTKWISQIHQAAWDEKSSPVTSNPLLKVRTATSRQWWNGISDIPAKRRRLDGIAFNRKGPQTFWEDPIIAGMGADWRSKRDGCANKCEWNATWHHFHTTLLTNWHFPSKQVTKAVHKTRVSKPEEPRPSAFPELRIHDEDKSLLHSSGELRFIVDNQTLQQVLSGITPLSDQQYLPVFRRMTAALDALFEGGYEPISKHDDPITWRERCFNKQADWLANRAMDENRSFQRCIIEDMDPSANYITFSDGGYRRSTGRAAAGWVTYKLKDGITTPVAWCAKVIDSCRSSFLAELVALDDAICTLSNLHAGIPMHSTPTVVP